MVTFDQVWHFPDGETHLPSKMQRTNLRVDGRLTYQYPLYRQGLARCRTRGVAVDVGAHVGLFSFWMVRDFTQVIAFEPVERHRECWAANVPRRPQDVLHACALGATEGAVALQAVTPTSSGGSYVAGPGLIPLRTLDSFSLPAIDLLKIDTEGYEREVVKGGRETLRRCRPTCIVEQRPKQVARYKQAPLEAIRFLQRLGAEVTWTDHRDYVLVFP